MDTDTKPGTTLDTTAAGTAGSRPDAVPDAPTALPDEALDNVAGGNQVLRNPKSPFDTPLD
ncbi:hypothetical protein GCM10007301_52940 [Azorhizobium oxalatiphilum]|uniref:Uncharacterized protein n=1 Tax=Azorhizobium oxalatiphilum TaxID=980631 RepID=A0A917CEK0_9HYPH|nr:hypothetical protein [Azorhizobium oxalatiphilum]GGF86475.1 hypothetical protein GCM10007301_52940 [Azorhizobium oxalatiphilum]